MKNLPLPVDEQIISQQLGRSIKSPIYVTNLDKVGINQNLFIETFSPFFEQLPWDTYDPKKMQIELLMKWFPDKKHKICASFKPYFLGKQSFDALEEWTSQLTAQQLEEIQGICPWRRRSIAKFRIEEQKDEILITRQPIHQFVQAVQDDDYRSWARIFQEALPEHVENNLFRQFLTVAFKAVQKTRQNIGQSVTSANIVAHFMSVQSTSNHPGNNSPEGAHEDGSDYIVSALVINRTNITGGTSQIIERLKNGTKEVIYSHTLKPGEFIFQADSRDEIAYGTDLWHHVTPFSVADLTKGHGWRDIIGFDINVD